MPPPPNKLASLFPFLLLLAGGLCLDAAARPPTDWTTGGKSVLILRVGFTDNPPPADPSGGWTNVMNEVNAFYLRNSYGAAWISGFAVAPVIAMDTASTNYEPLSDWKTTAFLPDIRAKARQAGFDTDDYDIEIIQTRITNAAAGASGSALHGGKGMWLNYTNGYPKFVQAVAHEIGHNLGLFHTRGFSAANYAVYPLLRNGMFWDEYGCYSDTMGYGPTNPLADFCAYDKNFLGWLPDTAVARPETSGTYRIHAFDQGTLSGTNFLALRWTRDARNHYWFEFRQALSNQAWSMNGLLVFWGGEETLASSGSPMQLDMTPGSRGLFDADPIRLAGATMHDGPLLLGHTYVDAGANFRITPLRKGGTAPESLDVVVQFGAFPSNRPPLATLIATNTAAATNQLLHFSVSAADPDGDPLACYWEFDDPATHAGIVPFGSAGIPVDASLATNAGHVWTTAGVFQVRCTVTDMKGGRVTASALVTVGGGGNALTISGTVQDEAGRPVEGAIVNNLKFAAPGQATFGSTGFLASAETASNGQFTVRVRPNSTNYLRAHANGWLFTTNPPQVAQTAVVVVASTSVSSLVFKRVTNLWTISGTVLIAGNTRTYNPAVDGPLVVTELRSGRSTNTGTNGTWQLQVPGGPVQLAFTSASNYPVHYGFPNPYEVHDHFNLFTVLVDVPGAASRQGFGTNALSGDGSATNVALPVVLTPPDGWTNPAWFAATWLGGFVDERSTARYGVDYRLDGMEITFTNQTQVFTNFITLHVRPGAATNSRLVVLRLEGFNTGANLGANSNLVYAIIPPGADADADGLPDWWEWRFAQNLTNLTATADPDQDGADHRAEFLADTDPFDPASRLAFTGIADTPGGLQLTWRGGVQATQVIEGRLDLRDGAAPWFATYTNLPPTAPTSSVLIPKGAAGSTIWLIRPLR